MTKPLTLNFCIVEYPLGPMYINSLLGNLNSRRYFREYDQSQWTTLELEMGNTTSFAFASGTQASQPAIPLESKVCFCGDIQADKALQFALTERRPAGTTMGDYCTDRIIKLRFVEVALALGSSTRPYTTSEICFCE